MPDPAAPNPHPGKSRDPNFFAVIVAGAVALVIFLVGACVYIDHSGRHVLPHNHPSRLPHSYLRMPAPSVEATPDATPA
ncbi:MAG TPA: hypothetical protein VHX60_01530 [Acidobacteriaceae bacterium]|jgi:hypothetical protein|nr:hypothetical protein [Acidobacteriaceae bacterium]